MNTEIVDLNNTLLHIKRRILLGFSDENYQWISYLLAQVQTMVEPQLQRNLEEMWRDSYTSSVDTKALNNLIKSMMTSNVE